MVAFHHVEVNLSQSIYNTKCHLKVGGSLTLSNKTDFVYSDEESLAAGICVMVIAALGVMFNVTTVAAVLQTRGLRREYLTPFIISLSLTEALFSLVALPVRATNYLMRYISSLNVYIPMLFSLYK